MPGAKRKKSEKGKREKQKETKMETQHAIFLFFVCVHECSPTPPRSQRQIEADTENPKRPRQSAASQVLTTRGHIS